MIWNLFKNSNCHILSPFFICGPFLDYNKKDLINENKRIILKKYINDNIFFENSVYLFAEDLCIEKEKYNWCFDFKTQEKIMCLISECSFIFRDTDATSTEAEFISNNSFNYNFCNLIPKELSVISEFNKEIEKQNNINTLIKYNSIIEEVKIEEVKKNSIHWHIDLKNNDEFWYSILYRLLSIKLTLKMSYMFFPKLRRSSTSDLKYFITYEISDKEHYIYFYIPLRQFFNFFVSILNRYKNEYNDIYITINNEEKLNKLCKSIIEKINLINLNTFKFIKAKSIKKSTLTNFENDTKYSNYKVITKVIFENDSYNPINFLKHLFFYLEKIGFFSNLINSEYVNKNNLIVEKNVNLKKEEIFNKINEICKLIKINSFSHVFFQKNKYWKTYKIKKSNGKFRYIYTYKNEYEDYKMYHTFLDKYNNLFLHNNFDKNKLNFSYAYKKKTNIMNLLHKHKKSISFFSFDIDNFFNSINHKILAKNTSSFFEKTLSLDLIKNYIKFCSTTNKGINIGFVSSPILSNIYLYKFDKKMDKFLKSKKFNQGNTFIYTRYADDILISSTKICDKVKYIELKNKVNEYLKDIYLNLNNKEKYIENIKTSSYYNNKFFGIILFWKNNQINYKLPNFYFEKMLYNLRNKKIYTKNYKDYICGKISYAKIINEEQVLKYFSRISKIKNIDIKKIENFILKKYKN